VSSYAQAIAVRLGSDDAECEVFAYAGLLHDIGKLTLPPDLLNKAAPLSCEEVELFRIHPLVGGEMVRRIPLLSHLAPHVRAHHERLDGRGYPDRLQGQQVSLCARVLAVADAYDAMTSDRPYRAALTSAEAQSELQGAAGGQFDPDIVAAFVGLLNSGAQPEGVRHARSIVAVEASTT
jgi:HD-GYP domain-containing protein (c-di-GMP phosphodiesterase class II)